MENLTSACPENKAISAKERLKRYNIIQKVLIYLAVALFITLLVLLNIYFEDLYYRIYTISKEAIDGGFWQMIGITSFFAVLFQMLFIPGISFYLIYLGFITKNYFKAFILVYPQTLVVVIASYYISKYTIKDWLYRWLKGKRRADCRQVVLPGFFPEKPARALENQLAAAGAVDSGDVQELHHRVDGRSVLDLFRAGSGLLRALLEHVHFGGHVDREHPGFDEAPNQQGW